MRNATLIVNYNKNSTHLLSGKPKLSRFIPHVTHRKKQNARFEVPKCVITRQVSKKNTPATKKHTMAVLNHKKYKFVAYTAHEK